MLAFSDAVHTATMFPLSLTFDLGRLAIMGIYNQQQGMVAGTNTAAALQALIDMLETDGQSVVALLRICFTCA